MFSYEVNVRKINSPKLKGVASVIIDNILEIDGFKIIEGSNGLFVSVPSHKGAVMEDGQKVEKYFDDVKFKGEDGLLFSKELKDSILSSYTSAADPLRSAIPPKQDTSKAELSSARKQAAQKETAAASTPAPARQSKPLWGF
jgi:DNA-binding cell septation regulator SpoVG